MVPNIIEQPEDALQLMGRDVSFRCTAFGIPRPDITWIFVDRNNAMNELTSTSITEIDGGVIYAELNLTAITTEDFGVYTCVATNKFEDDMEMADLEQGSKSCTSYFSILLNLLKSMLIIVSYPHLPHDIAISLCGTTINKMDSLLYSYRKISNNIIRINNDCWQCYSSIISC